jgi:hypothetical protein
VSQGRGPRLGGRRSVSLGAYARSPTLRTPRGRVVRGLWPLVYSAHPWDDLVFFFPGFRHYNLPLFIFFFKKKNRRGDRTIHHTPAGRVVRGLWLPYACNFSRRVSTVSALVPIYAQQAWTRPPRCGIMVVCLAAGLKKERGRAAPS